MTIGQYGTSYDFGSPYMHVTIVRGEKDVEASGGYVTESDGTSRYVSSSQNNDRIPLYFTDDLVNPSILHKAGIDTTNILPYMTELKIEMNLGQMPKINVHLSPPFREGIELLSSDIIECNANRLEVEFGYAIGEGSYRSPVIVGMMLLPAVTIGQDISIGLVGQGVNDSFRAISEAEPRTFKNKTRQQIIKEILKGSDMKNMSNLQIDDSKMKPMSPSVYTPDQYSAATQNWKRYAEERVTITGGNLSSWLLMWRIARECGAWLNQFGEKLDIRQADVVSILPPKLTLALYDYADAPVNIGPRAGVYPILAVTSPNTNLYLSQLRGRVLSDVSRDSSTVVTTEIDDKTHPSAKIGPSNLKGKGANAPKVGSGTPATKANYPGSPENSSVKAQAVADYQTGNTSMGTELVIDTIGIPDIIPSDTVSVTGLGKRYDCRAGYSIFKITHTLNSSGFSTQLNMRADTRSILDSNATTFKMYNSREPTKREMDPDQAAADDAEDARRDSVQKEIVKQKDKDEWSVWRMEKLGSL